MDQVEVVLANNECVTLRVGDVFLKVDGDQARADREVEAMKLSPVPTPDVLWRKPPVLALAAIPGRTLARIGQPSAASPAAWTAVGVAVRSLHEAPLPTWPGTGIDELAARLTGECEWLEANLVLPIDVLRQRRAAAETVLQTSTLAFIHGDLHLEHVFVDGDQVSGVIDWSEAAPGDPLFDVATLTLGHPERLDDFLAGYGDDVDRDRILAWRAFRCLVGIRWLSENGYGTPASLPETAILRSLM